MAIRIGPGIVVGRQGIRLTGGGAVATDWWLAAGTIGEANVLEHVESPTAGQLYAGGTIAAGQPWTLAVRGTWSGADSNYAFDNQDNRLILGVSTSLQKCVYANGSWQLADTGSLLVAADHVYYVVCNGTTAQAYRDNVAVGSAFACSGGIGVSGSTRWRRDFSNTGASWTGVMPAAAVLNIALSEAQRDALYTAMAAL